MSTARLYLQQLLEEIDRGPFNISKVCTYAGMHPSMVSRWKKLNIEPRLSTLERLAEAHSAMLAERAISKQALAV